METRNSIKRVIEYGTMTESTKKSDNAHTCTTGRTISLRSNDGTVVQLSSSSARLSQLIQSTIESEEDEVSSPIIDLPKVNSTCLAKVVDFCHHYAVDPMIAITTPLTKDSLEEIVTQQWYRTFVPDAMLFELVKAANYLEIYPLLDLTCLLVSVRLLSKTHEEIRVILNISRMTPAEEAQARKDHPWVFCD